MDVRDVHNLRETLEQGVHVTVGVREFEHALRNYSDELLSRLVLRESERDLFRFDLLAHAVRAYNVCNVLSTDDRRRRRVARALGLLEHPESYLFDAIEEIVAAYPKSHVDGLVEDMLAERPLRRKEPALEHVLNSVFFGDEQPGSPGEPSWAHLADPEGDYSLLTEDHFRLDTVVYSIARGARGTHATADQVREHTATFLERYAEGFRSQAVMSDFELKLASQDASPRIENFTVKLKPLAVPFAHTLAKKDVNFRVVPVSEFAILEIFRLQDPFPLLSRLAEDAFAHGASRGQRGDAAALRTYTHGSMRRALNQIVHSADKTQAYGPNPYEDKSGAFNPRAQRVLDSS